MLRRTVLLIVIIAMPCFVLNIYSEFVLSEGQWGTWQEYNAARSSVSDYPLPDYDEVAGQLTALGISQNDYFMMQNWMTADIDVFTVDKLQAVGDLGGFKAIGWRQSIHSALMMLTGVPLVIFLTFVFIGVSIFSRVGGAVALTLGMGILASGMCLALLWSGRLPSRVFIVVMLACFTSIAFTCSWVSRVGWPEDWQSNRKALVCLVLCAACLLCEFVPAVMQFDLRTPSYYLRSSTEGVDNPDESVRFFLDENEEKTYLWDMYSYMSPELSFHLKQLPEPSFYRQNFLLGGWTMDSPMRNALNEEMGWSNPILGLVEKDNAYLVMINEDAVTVIQTFLREHYARDTDYEVVDWIYRDGVGMPVMKLIEKVPEG